MPLNTDLNSAAADPGITMSFAESQDGVESL